mgnify:FL=1|jgi:hypothetical protein
MFDMDDCAVEIWCPEMAEVSEVERMVFLLESMVNIVDIKIGSRVEDLLSDQYQVVLTEHKASGRSRFKK